MSKDIKCVPQAQQDLGAAVDKYKEDYCFINDNISSISHYIVHRFISIQCY